MIHIQKLINLIMLGMVLCQLESRNVKRRSCMSEMWPERYKIVICGVQGMQVTRFLDVSQQTRISIPSLSSLDLFVNH